MMSDGNQAGQEGIADERNGSELSCVIKKLKKKTVTILLEYCIHVE